MPAEAASRGDLQEVRRPQGAGLVDKVQAAMKRKREVKSDTTVNHSYDANNSAVFSQVDEPTLQYFKEVSTRLVDEQDPEQKCTLASSALTEAKDKEEILGRDPVCSRILEALLAVASPESIEEFALGAFKGDCLIALASSACGSHVIERLLEFLMAQESEHSQKILQGAAQTVAEQIYEFSTDRFGSHVARSLIGLAAGIELQSLQGSNTGQPVKAHNDGKIQKGLSHKVALKRTDPSSSEIVNDSLISPIVEALLKEEFRGALSEELPYHQYGSPFLQTVLLASQDNGGFLKDIIPRILGASGSDCATGLANLQAEDIHAFMQDRTSSHLIEVILIVAPENIFEQLEQRVFRNHMAYLAMHPVANFVVQAFLSAVKKSPQMKAVVKELRGSFPTLLRSKRGGVLSAAVAAAARTGTGQVDLSSALSAALRDLPGNQQGPAAALLTLDLACKLDGLPLSKRLSTLGCTILCAMAAFVKDASAEFVDNFVDLPPQQMARVAADPGGSRVTEAVLESASVNAKAKKKLLKKLGGFFGTISLTPAGNFLVQKCYSVAGIKDKETIAEDLAKVETELAATPRGMKLLLRCQVADFKRNSEKWRNHVQSAAAIQKEFADLIEEPSTMSPAEPDTQLETTLTNAKDPQPEGETKPPKLKKKKLAKVSKPETRQPEEETEQRQKSQRKAAKVSKPEPTHVEPETKHPKRKEKKAAKEGKPEELGDVPQKIQGHAFDKQEREKASEAGQLEGDIAVPEAPANKTDEAQAPAGRTGTASTSKKKWKIEKKRKAELQDLQGARNGSDLAKEDSNCAENPKKKRKKEKGSKKSISSNVEEQPPEPESKGVESADSAKTSPIKAKGSKKKGNQKDPSSKDTVDTVKSRGVSILEEASKDGVVMRLQVFEDKAASPPMQTPSSKTPARDKKKGKAKSKGKAKGKAKGKGSKKRNKYSTLE